MIDHDFFFETVRKSPEGDYPVVKLLKETTLAGGAGAVVNMLNSLGEFSHTAVHSKNQPCVKRRHFVDGKQLFRWDEDYTSPISTEEAERLVEGVTPHSVVLISDYGKGAITYHLLNCLKKVPGVRIFVDPARNRDLSFYSGVEGIIPNRFEARIQEYATANESIIAAKEIYWRLSEQFKNICIKLDKHGMLINGHWQPVTQRNIVDVCGAGDMVLAAIGHKILCGNSFDEAAVFANKMAGLVCLQQGATYDSGLLKS